MPKELKQAVSQLNHLIQICLDGEQGFRLASNAVEDLPLKGMFREYSTQRADFSRELQLEVGRLGQEPATDGSLLGSVHRGWMNFKEMVPGQDQLAIVNECERGEDAAVEAYQNVLASDSLPHESQALVARQYVMIKAAHDRIHELEQSATQV